jgi:hypothetical protein
MKRFPPDVVKRANFIVMKTLLRMIAICVLIAGCSKTIDNTGNCSDGVKNQGEQGIDCGGPCGNACPSCADGIMNQNETGVDCGGPCDPCYARLSAKISGNEWYATSRNAFISAPGTMRIYGTNGSYNITLFYSGPFAAGTVSAGSTFRAELRDSSGTLYNSTTTGSISFAVFDTAQKTMTGIYDFTATEPISGNQLVVSNGVFNLITY